MDSAAVFSIIGVAVSSSFGHCIAMCGGFVAAISNLAATGRASKGALTILVYNLSRVAAYIVLGALFGAFGAIFSLSLRTRGYMLFAVGIFMIVLGLALIRRGKILNFIEYNPLIYKFINSKMRAFLPQKSLFAVMSAGFLNGLLPCGVVYYFLAMAIASASAVQGALVMTIFGVVSFAAMSAYAFLFKFLGEKFKGAMFYFSGVIIVIYGIYLAFAGFMATNG